MNNIQAYYDDNVDKIDDFLISLILEDYICALSVISKLERVSDKLRLFFGNLLLENLHKPHIVENIRNVLVKFPTEFESPIKKIKVCKNTYNLFMNDSEKRQSFYNDIQYWKVYWKEIDHNEAFLNTVLGRSTVKAKKVFLTAFMKADDMWNNSVRQCAYLFRVLEDSRAHKNISISMYSFQYMMSILGGNDISYFLQVLLYEFETKPINFLILLFSHKIEKDYFLNWCNTDLEKLYTLLMLDVIQKLPAKEFSRLQKVNRFFFIDLLKVITKKDSEKIRGLVLVMNELHSKLLSKEISLCDKDRLQSIFIIGSYLEQF